MRSNLENRKKILFLTQFSMLLIIEAIVCFYRPLGSVPFFSGIVATLAHIPVIITALLLGTGAGAAMGFFAGIFSMIVWTFMPPPEQAAIAFVFSPFVSGNFISLLISVVPRVLIGVVAGASFKLFNRLFVNFDRGKILTYGLSGILGSLANTIFVLGGIYVFFGPEFALANEVSYDLLLKALLIIVATNGVFEVILGSITGYAVCRPIRKHLKLD